MPCDSNQGTHSGPKIDVCATAHVSGLSQLAKKSVRWQSCQQSRYPPEIHITTCAVPVPLCQSHCSCAIAPVESRLCHRALQLFSWPWLCPHACANVPVPGPSYLGHRAHAIVPVPSFHQAIVPVPAPSRPCHCSITSDNHADNITSVTHPHWCCYRLYQSPRKG